MNAVQLININKTFKDKPILKDLSFVVKEGSFFGIIGKSGSGKTTIVKLLMRFSQIKESIADFLLVKKTIQSVNLG